MNTEYTEALQRAKELSKKEGLAKGTTLYKEVLCYIFPELAESEDEKIRKEIIEYLTVDREIDLCSRPDRQKWINWLEKQKKPKYEPVPCDLSELIVPPEQDSERTYSAWKPTKEQLDVLDKVYHYLWEDRFATADMQDGLGDLIDELKKLK